MVFSKLKCLLHKHAAGTFDALIAALVQICDLFSPAECHNTFKAVEIEAD
jgi:hypothetical protein